MCFKFPPATSESTFTCHSHSFLAHPVPRCGCTLQLAHCQPCLPLHSGSAGPGGPPAGTLRTQTVPSTSPQSRLTPTVLLLRQRPACTPRGSSPSFTQKLYHRNVMIRIVAPPVSSPHSTIRSRVPGGSRPLHLVLTEIELKLSWRRPRDQPTLIDCLPPAAPSP